MARVFLLSFAIAVVAVSDANAQIYAWRDVNGTLVLSDRKLNDGALTYDVPESPSIRSTTPMADVALRDQFEPLIREHATRHALRVELVRAVIQVESGYNPRARSPKGAMGLMQLMPATARQLGVGNPFDPAENIRGGCAYLRQLLDRYQRWRSLDALSVAFATDTLTRIYGVPGKTASAVRRLGMGLVGRISPLRNRLMSEARGTSGDLPLLLRGLSI